MLYGVAAIPFIQRGERGKLDYWKPESETGDWGRDNDLGRQYADDLLLNCPAEDMPRVLTRISEAISATGRHEGIEVGFFNRLGEYLAQRGAQSPVKEVSLAA